MMDPFDAVREAAYAEQKAKQQFSFQARCVKEILKSVGSSPADVVRQHPDLRPVKNIYGLDWFREAFPQFPVHIMTSKLPYVAKAKWAELFAGIHRFKWFKEYVKQADEDGVDVSAEHAALLFNLPHAVKGTIMVLHNQPVQVGGFEDPEYRRGGYVRIMQNIGKDDTMYVVEQLKSFLVTVGAEWAENS